MTPRTPTSVSAPTPVDTTPVPDPADAGARYAGVRARTEELAAPLSPEDQTVQSMPDVSPTKWHRAHTSWFFEEFLLEEHAPGYAVFDPAFRYLFNSYYEAVGPRYPRPRRGLVTRPGVAEVAAYRRHVDRAMAALLDKEPTPRVAELLDLGLHHEQQHQELLLMDIKHVLWQSPLRPAYAPPAPAGTGAALAEPGWVGYDGGVVEVGHAAGGFCFDNETPRHRVLLEPYALTDRLVTAGEWQAFIDDDGYRRPDLWLSDGWYAVTGGGWEAPLYWERDGGGWSVFTLTGQRPVDQTEPVTHVSYYEADAFARWAGARLPTEAEWEHAAAFQEEPRVDGSDAAVRVHPRPAAPGSGLRQLYGETWQWTSSAYLPYPRFAAAPGAVGEYNGKFMVGQHVLRGSAAVTQRGHARLTYRNFFPPSARWPFTGLRLARHR